MIYHSQSCSFNFLAVLSTPLIYAQDLSRYREFQFGMNLLAVAKQSDVKPSDAKVIHQRPAMIQELEWRPRHALAVFPRSRTRLRRSSSAFTTASFFEW